MASWIEELFPAKFKVDDLSDSDLMKSASSVRNESVQKIYDDVFAEMFSKRSAKYQETSACPQLLQDQGQTRGHQDNSGTLVSSKIITADPRMTDNPKLMYEEKRSKRIETSSETKCIWSAKELEVLRKSLKCTKLNNIRLSVLAQTLQKDCERVRSVCHEQEKEILKLNRRYNEVKTQNKTMKITCMAFKEDARTSQQRLEDCQGQLKGAIRDKESAELELVKIKHELEVVQKQNKMLKLELEKQKALQEKLLENQNVSVRSFYEKEIADLVEKLQEIKLCLKKERNEHAVNKKALAHLRLHFTNDRQ